MVIEVDTDDKVQGCFYQHHMSSPMEKEVVGGSGGKCRHARAPAAGESPVRRGYVYK